MLLSALTSCGRQDLAAYVQARREASRRDLIHRTQGTLRQWLHLLNKIQRERILPLLLVHVPEARGGGWYCLF